MTDPSNGYDAIADEFVFNRTPWIGPTVVRQWARTLAPSTEILDVGCGSGVPISEVLFAEGHRVFGVDASERLLAKFRARYPHAMAECCPAEDSNFFGRRFDALISWGMMFLLPEETQRIVIGRFAKALNPGGKLLVTSPEAAIEWLDGMTDLRSVSLGKDEYVRLLAENNLQVVGHASDEGDNFYYFAVKGPDGEDRAWTATL